MVKKLSGEGKATAEWFTSIGNELSQVVSFVLTCEESTEMLKPMCHGVMERFQQANQPVPKILYVDRGCCRERGATALENLFQPWVENGMVVRLDIFHWIHRFDAAVRTESHSKCAAFKSALAGAVLAYNRADLDLLIKAVRAKNPETRASLTDKDMIRLHVSREQLKHHVRRVTMGAQETFNLVHTAIEELKGPAGLDESGVSLFKTPGKKWIQTYKQLLILFQYCKLFIMCCYYTFSTAHLIIVVFYGLFPEAIDGMWAAQQRHLECIQDPPDMAMYRVARATTINGVDVPYYKCVRGSNSLEGFHKFLPHMIPGTIYSIYLRL